MLEKAKLDIANTLPMGFAGANEKQCTVQYLHRDNAANKFQKKQFVFKVRQMLLDCRVYRATRM